MKSNIRKQTNSKRNKPSPYLISLASLGVVAFSVSTFSLYTSINSNVTDVAANLPSSTTSSQIINKDNSKNNSASPQLAQQAPVPTTQPPVKQDTKISAFSAKNNNRSVKDTKVTPPNVLTGKLLDDILTERTGISELPIEDETTSSSVADATMDTNIKTNTTFDSGFRLDLNLEQNSNNQNSISNTNEIDDFLNSIFTNVSRRRDDEENDRSNETDENSSSATLPFPGFPTDDDTAAITPPVTDGGTTLSGNFEGKTYGACYSPSTIGDTGFSNIASWKEKNSDVKGWLRIPNTNIDYPVVVGPSTLYYNDKGYNKQYSKNGVIWADSYTKFGNAKEISQNNVLYGHNWTNYSSNPKIGDPNDVMYAQLTSFHHLDFAKNTPYIHYSTSSQAMTWKVFAVFYTEDSFDYIQSDMGPKYITNVISEAKKRSLHDYDVDVNSKDKILTLSTCTRAYGQRSDQRFVVMARLMRKDEKVEPVSITANTDFKKPRF